MNYNEFEAAVRERALKVFRANGIHIDDLLKTGTGGEYTGGPRNLDDPLEAVTVWLWLDEPVTPLPYFLGNVVFTVDRPMSDDVRKGCSPGLVFATLGNYCSDTKAAEQEAIRFDEGDDINGWFIESNYETGRFVEECGIMFLKHLGWAEDFESDEAFLQAVEDAIADFYDEKFIAQLRPLIRYFEA